MRSCMIALLIFSSMSVTARAQHASLAAARQVRRSVVAERIKNAENDRMRWEAAQTWLAPSVPQPSETNEARLVHIGQNGQPLLRLPRLRREWLTGSSEPAAGNCCAEIEDDLHSASTLRFSDRQNRQNNK